jgi:hypothetical protein
MATVFLTRRDWYGGLRSRLHVNVPMVQVNLTNTVTGLKRSS